MRRAIAAVALLSFALNFSNSFSIFNSQFSILPAEAAAGINPVVNYQGKISVINGSAVGNGMYNMRFRIYDAATSGNLLWTETWNNSTQRVTMTGGLFSVGLGTHTAMTGMDFNSDSLYLQVEFDPGNDGTYEETFSPRRRFASVVYAHNANTLDGIDSTQFVRKDQANTMTGTITLTNTETLAIVVKGALSGAAIHASRNLSTSGSLVVDKAVQFKNYASCALISTDASGNLGCSAGAVSTGSVIAIGDGRYVKKSGDTMTGVLVIQNGNTHTAASTPLLNVRGTMSGRSLILSGTGGAPLFFTDHTSGRIGINTEQPGSLIEARSSADATAVRIVYTGTPASNAGGGSFQGLIQTTPTAAGQRLGDVSFGAYDSGGTSRLGALIRGWAGEAWGSLASRAAYLTFETTPLSSTTRLERLRITTEGDVGIGSTSPDSKLEVVGTMSGRVVYAQKTLASSGALVWEGAASGASLYVATSLQGAGLTDCDVAATSKLLWDSTTGRFSCGSDQTGGGSAFGSGNVVALGDARYVNTSGDTMTGALTINILGGNNSTLGLNVLNTISGSVIRAQKTLASSGTLIVEEGMSIDANTLFVSSSLNRVGINTNDPASAFDVRGDMFMQDSTPRFVLKDDDSTANEASTLEFWNMHNNLKARLGMRGSGEHFYLESVDDAGDMIFETADREHMRILSTGFVGIGTNNPGSKLSVSGSVIIGSAIGSSAADAGLALEVIGTMSGRMLYAADGVSLGSTHSGNLLTITDLAQTGTKALLVSVDQMGLGQLEGGAFFGHVGLRENQWALSQYGESWTSKDSSRNWQAIALSSDGKIQTAAVYSGQLYTSEDFGNTWTARDSSRTWRNVAMSSDGKIQAAVNEDGSIYQSNDYGQTWRAKATSESWQAIALSSDGKIQTAVGDAEQIYVSTDYGNTWNAKDSARDWYGVAMSSDGKIQTAGAYGGQIYISADYGKTWTAKDSSRNWYGVAMSSDGKIQTAVVYAGQMYVSNNYGNTWTAKDSSRNWRNISMSGDGKIQTASVYGGQLYVSTDYGNTWAAKDSSRSWTGLDMSSDGKVQAANVALGTIYVSHSASYQYGSVGIGTSSPGARLHVRGASGEHPELRLQSVGTNTVPYISFYSNGTGSGSIQYRPDNPGLHFQVGGAGYPATTRVSFMDSGNVGIGSGSNLYARQTIYTADAFNNEALLIHSAETTGSQNMLKIITDVTSVNNTVFRINASGAVFSDQSYRSTGADYAEWFYSSTPGMQPGDAVCIDITQPNTVKKCASDADGNVMGIVSTNPAFIGNSIGGADGIIPPGYVLVGLIGQVPAKVKIENNESVRPGDSLAAGSTPGFARRARAGESTVGVALEGLDEGEGVINVLISRRNQSMTVEAVEEKVLKTIANMEIADEVELMVSDALGDLNVDAQIAEEVERQIAVLNTQSLAIEQINAELSLLKAQIASLKTQSGAISSQASVLSGSVHHLAASTMELESTLTTGGDARIGGDLSIDGTLNASSLFVPNGMTIDGGIIMNGMLDTTELRVTSGAIIDGTLAINHSLVLGSGATIDFGSGAVNIASLVIDRSLFILGDITIDGLATFMSKVEIKGELVVSNKHAGYAMVPEGSTEVTVHFGTGFTSTPVVTASPDVPVLYGIAQTTQTGFTIRLSEPAAKDIVFGWHALGTNDITIPVLKNADDQMIFPLDTKGVPVSSNMAWNACIRNITLLDESGQPLSCARYHDGYTWTHPDLLISFLWNTSVHPAILHVPDAFVPTVTETAESVEGALNEDSEEIDEIEEVDDASASGAMIMGSSSSSSANSTVTDTGSTILEEAISFSASSEITEEASSSSEAAAEETAEDAPPAEEAPVEAIDPVIIGE